MVSKSVKLPAEKFSKFVLEAEKTAIENIKLKRISLEKLSVRITILCLKGYRSYKEVAEELGDDYDYIKKVMDKLAENGTLISRNVFRNGKDTKIFTRDISEEMKAWGISRLPFTKDGVRITEPIFRNMLYLRAKRMENIVNSCA